MPDRLDHARGLLQKGDSDLLTVRTMLAGDARRERDRRTRQELRAARQEWRHLLAVLKEVE